MRHYQTLYDKIRTEIKNKALTSSNILQNVFHKLLVKIFNWKTLFMYNI